VGWLGLLRLLPLLLMGADLFAPPLAVAAVEPSQQRRLVLDRRQRQLLVLEGNQERKRFPVGVGRPGWETPVGQFSVVELAVDPTWEHPATASRPDLPTPWVAVGLAFTATARVAPALTAANTLW
jgi:hypothetical protein